jgi:dipeptidyl aminopeptidase/acylaminoacyl peptidase
MASSLVAPVGSIIGLAIVAILTVSLLTGELPFSGGSEGPDGGPSRTPDPSGDVVVDPRTEVPGSIVYVKSGNVWVQSGNVVRKVTEGGGASAPSWSPDGEWIYYVKTVVEYGRFPAQGTLRRYELHVPNLMRVHPDGTGAEQLATGKFTTASGNTWFFWINEPVASADGRTLALTSDGPNPFESNVVIQLFDLETRTFTKPDLAEIEPLGHQDPAWRSDGLVLYYVQNNRDGALGQPSILNFDTTTGRARTTTGPGYVAPAVSPDGRFVAATRTDAFGTNVVILDLNGGELIRLTDDGRSWSPAWSPKGDAIAFLHLDRGSVDLRLVPLEGEAPRWTLGERINLTDVSGLDGGSAPHWFIPADQLPPPTPAPSAPSPSADASEEPAASAAP